MQAILEATQIEAELSRCVALQSQRLSEEMREDSGAMKTVLKSLLGLRYEANRYRLHF